MEERKFIQLKKEEYAIKEYVKRFLGRGRISKLDIEYTPVGEKIIIATSTPGLVIGRKGEKIEELTSILKTRFKLENPHIEIKEIENPLFDSQIVADDIALSLEKIGNIKFKVVAYKKLQEIMSRGALGCEIRLSGKLPSERAKSWRFSEGYLKKAGDSTKEVDRSQSTALTKTGIIGIKVAIMRPDAKLYDRVNITPEILNRIRVPTEEKEKTEKVEEIIENSDNNNTNTSEFSNKTIPKKGDKIKGIVYKEKKKESSLIKTLEKKDSIKEEEEQKDIKVKKTRKAKKEENKVEK